MQGKEIDSLKALLSPVAPPLKRSMASSDKYDRQLRLWGANGQRALMNAKILLVQADSVGIEALKNLVLPGVGHFTILDDFIVNAKDLGCNFFFTEESIGKPRAEIATAMLSEMNEDTKGLAVVANASNLFLTEPSFFEQFSLIITANSSESFLAPLAAFCWERSIAFMTLRSYGFIGSLRLQLRNHHIIESKVEADQYDLRISNPFPTLKAFCDSIDLAQLDASQHCHVPYIVLLNKAIVCWKDAHEGAMPKTTKDKNDFKALIKSMAMDGGAKFSDELNFIEAVNESYRAFTTKKASWETAQCLNNQISSTLTSNSSDFDFLVRALQMFTASTDDNSLPLPGPIPDMTSTTENFVQLQQIYHDKALQDRATFKQLLDTLLGAASVPIERISDETIDLFCKNSATVSSVTTSQVSEGTADSNRVCGECIRDIFDCELYDDAQQTPIMWYLALCAADKFYEKHGRWPGDCTGFASLRDASSSNSSNNKNATNELELLERDKLDLIEHFRCLCVKYGLALSMCEKIDEDSGRMALDSGDGSGATAERGDDEEEAVSHAPTLSFWPHALELVRYAGKELHNISSIIGGIAAQEAVKIITHQYKPLENTYVYNGIAGCGAAYSL